MLIMEKVVVFVCVCGGGGKGYFRNLCISPLNFVVNQN